MPLLEKANEAPNTGHSEMAKLANLNVMIKRPFRVDRESLKRSKSIKYAAMFEDEESPWKYLRFKVEMCKLLTIGVCGVGINNEDIPLEDDKSMLENRSDGEVHHYLDLTLLHVIILQNDTELLEEVLEKYDIPMTSWKEPVKAWQFDFKDVLEENSWIKKANCFHLAAKYNPIGLHQLLSRLEQETEKLMIIEANTVSPLHVAAMKPDSLSLQ